jgi:hypothetical protein
MKLGAVVEVRLTLVLSLSFCVVLVISLLYCIHKINCGIIDNIDLKRHRSGSKSACVPRTDTGYDTSSLHALNESFNVHTIGVKVI